MGSLYTSESGEWRVGGFEVLSSIKDDEAIIYVSIVKISYLAMTDGLSELRKSGSRFGTIYSTRVGEIWLGCYQTRSIDCSGRVRLWHAYI